jgi:hypothetical protein
MVAPVACDSADWSPIGSAASHSQLAGVVAGLVFAGIVVILERQASTRRPAEALTMFVAGFFTFALDGFFFAVVAGERTCARAWTETMVAAGLLGFGALSLFVGVSWLLYSLDRTSSTPFRVTRVIVYVLALIVVAQLNATARDYLRDVRPAGQFRWIDTLLTAGLIVIVAVIAGHAALARRLRGWSRRSAGLAAYLAIAYVLVCALSFGLLTVVETSYWDNGARPVVYLTATLVAVMLPTLVVIIHLLALPSPELDPAPDPPAGPSAAPPVVAGPDPAARPDPPAIAAGAPALRPAVLGGAALIALGGALVAARRRSRRRRRR